VAAVRSRPRVAWTDASGSHVRAIDRTLVVGSASAADLVVADPTVSRLHAELEPRDDGIWVRDLGSRNGTFVGEVLVERARLSPAMSVRVGSTALTLADPVEASVELWPSDHFGEMFGRSPAMRELFMTLARVATLDSTVLLVGETGTGKELAASAVHAGSRRASGPFVVVDCGGLPEQLLESELFGHAKGAFTGAAAASEGAIEAANGGTVFLDELGELPIAMQPKLLRVLETRTVRRVGEATHRPVDVRYVCATHRDLPAMVNDGTFREDLYFRVAVLPVTLPPLRERLEDIPLLLEKFLPDLPDAERQALLAEVAGRRWRGNVRELRNFAERVAALGARRALAMADGAARPTAGAGQAAMPDGLPSFQTSYRAFTDGMEREYLRQLMTRHAGNAAEAAREAGIDRTYVYRLLRKHGL
jgi:DNA-binding NtrC family response regulator